MKRLFDFLVAFSALLTLLPLLILVAILVYLYLGGPVIFSQTRPGLHAKPFRMYKFRTMRDLRDTNGCLLDDEQRITAFGRFLRSTSLDELPELWNVLIGDMSLVGPRPLLMEYLPLYNEVQATRHEAKPGITGWAQINGRNAVSWEQKFSLDCWYVKNQSLKLDLLILLKTVQKVIKREGITAKDSVTVDKFKGNLK
ncbi:MAG: sugar transferase [Paraglaciecola sp.]|uniref:Sugar transferase n=1 Tax=Rheinheimera baltica TaxID=67576 RepID=A0ABT9HUZ3_9GAMM|nr:MULTISPECIES: sugar transferase [Gammaproteobacteria]MDP5031271.1 sugar transferase [Paraglaciecola sp.]MDP5133184.1 sugar transferase [Paraglaciecola sp.]MDP5134945.1 sugar transferase [Rheinheimera baltica]MDP5149804.1 sugar transferase [Rheinheimera baltica]